MHNLINSIIGDIEVSNDLRCMLSILLFVFVITVTVDLIDMLRGMGGK